MFTLDMPDVPQHYAATAIAQANQTQKATQSKERALGVCFAVPYNQPGQDYFPEGLSPAYSAAGYLTVYENRANDESPSANAELVIPPKHGKVVFTNEGGISRPGYVPDPGYVGDERIVFKATVDGKTVRVVYLLKVTKMFTGDSSAHDFLCKTTGSNWKISSASEFIPAAGIPGSIASLAGNLPPSLKIEVAS